MDPCSALGGSFRNYGRERRAIISFRLLTRMDRE